MHKFWEQIVFAILHFFKLIFNVNGRWGGAQGFTKFFHPRATRVKVHPNRFSSEDSTIVNTWRTLNQGRRHTGGLGRKEGQGAQQKRDRRETAQAAYSRELAPLLQELPQVLAKKATLIIAGF